MGIARPARGHRHCGRCFGGFCGGRADPPQGEVEIRHAGVHILKNHKIPGLAAAGYNLALIILPVFYSGEYTRWIALGAGLLLGGLSAWLGKVCIIAASSAAGGLALSDILITEVLARVATIESSRTETIIVLVLGFILAAAAMRYQFSTTEGDE